MNKKIGMIASIINVIAVGCFAVSMLVNGVYGYLASMFIAFSFMPMICGFACFAWKRGKLAGMVAVGFSIAYITIILLVYFAQLTAVRIDSLAEGARAVLDFQQYGLYFYYDMLGYALMALATFFAGLTVEVQTKADKWLKGLLMVHGIFFISCLLLPMLGIFTTQTESWIGVAVLEFWCIYFIPIGILSYRYFAVKEEV